MKTRRNPIASDPNLLAPNGRPIGVLLHTFRPKLDGDELGFRTSGMDGLELEAYKRYKANETFRFFVTSQFYQIAYMVYGGDWDVSDQGSWIDEPTQIVALRNGPARFRRSQGYGKYDSFLLWPMLKNGKNILRIYRVKQ